MNEKLREKVIKDFELSGEDLDILKWHIENDLTKLKGMSYRNFLILEPSATENVYEALVRYRNWLEYYMIADFAKLTGQDRSDFLKLNELAEYDDDAYDKLLDRVSEKVHRACDMQERLGRIKIVK